MATREEVIQVLREKGYQGPIPGEQQMPQAQGVQQTPQMDIQALLKKSQGQSPNRYIADILKAGTTGQVQTPSGNSQDNLLNKYLETAIGEQAKSLYADPTEKALRQAKINALNTPPPEGFVRVGEQILPDPNYIKPKDQREIDEAEAIKQAEVESIRSAAEQNLSNIQKAKEGSDFFGPLGGLPTIADPPSMLGFNKEHYAKRKDWENNINQLLSQKVVDLIAEMKRVSKTGATGFGQLSEQEGALLRNASTALSRDLPPEQAVYYLNEMEKINQRILSGGSPSVQAQQAGQPMGKRQVGRFVVEEA